MSANLSSKLFSLMNMKKVSTQSEPVAPVVTQVTPSEAEATFVTPSMIDSFHSSRTHRSESTDTDSIGEIDAVKLTASGLLKEIIEQLEPLKNRELQASKLRQIHRERPLSTILMDRVSACFPGIDVFADIDPVNPDAASLSSDED